MTRAAHKSAEPPPGAPGTTISTTAEKKQVEERVAIGAHVVYEAIRREGEEELRRAGGGVGVVCACGGIVDGFFVCRRSAADVEAAGYAVAAADFEIGLLRRIPCCDFGVPATLYRKYADGDFAAAAAEGH